MDHDLYHDWLQIPPGPRPPKPPALLGLRGRSATLDQIDAAAHRQLTRLNVYAKHADPAVRQAATRLMNEVAQARNTLRRRTTGAGPPPRPTPTPPAADPPASSAPKSPHRFAAAVGLLTGAGLLAGISVPSLFHAPAHPPSAASSLSQPPPETTAPAAHPSDNDEQTTDTPPIETPLTEAPAPPSESTPEAASPPPPPPSPAPVETATLAGPLPAEHLDENTTPTTTAAAEDLAAELTAHAPAAPPPTARVQLAHRLATELHDHLAEQEPPHGLRTTAELALVFAQTGDHQRAEPLLRTSLERVLESLASVAQGFNRPDRVPASTRDAFTALVHAHATLGTVDALNTRLLQEPTPVVYLAVTQLAPRPDSKPRRPSFLLPAAFQTPLVPVLIELAAPADGTPLSLHQAQVVADLFATQNADPTQIQTFLDRLPEDYHEHCRRQIVETLLDNQQPEKALALLEGGGSSRGKRDHDHTVLLAAALAASSDTERGFQVAKQVARRAANPKDLGPGNSLTRRTWQRQYLQLAAVFHRCGRPGEAKRMWENAVITALNTGQLPTDGQLGAVVYHLVTHQQADLAHRLILRRAAATDRESLALFLLRTLGPSLNDAQVSAQLKHISPTFEGTRHLLGLWRSVRHDHPALGERFLMATARSFSALDQASATTGAEPDAARHRLARNLCLALGEFGDIEQATRIAQTLPQDAEEYLARVSAYMAVHLPLDEAIHQAEQITDPDDQQTMVKDAVRYLVRDNDLAKAQVFATETAEIIDGLSPHSRALVFQRLFDASIEQRDWDSAAGYLAQIPSSGSHRSLANTVAHASIQERDPGSIALIPVLLDLSLNPQTTHIPLALALLEPLDGDETLPVDLPGPAGLAEAGQKSPPPDPEPATDDPTESGPMLTLMSELATTGSSPLPPATRQKLARQFAADAHEELAPNRASDPGPNSVGTMASLAAVLGQTGDRTRAHALLDVATEQVLAPHRTGESDEDGLPGGFGAHAFHGGGFFEREKIAAVAQAYASIGDADLFASHLLRERPGDTLTCIRLLRRSPFFSDRRTYSATSSRLRDANDQLRRALDRVQLDAALQTAQTASNRREVVQAQFILLDQEAPAEQITAFIDGLPTEFQEATRSAIIRQLIRRDRPGDALALQEGSTTDHDDPEHLIPRAQATAATGDHTGALALIDPFVEKLDPPATRAEESDTVLNTWRDHYLGLAAVYERCDRRVDATRMWEHAIETVRHLNPDPLRSRLGTVISHLLDHNRDNFADRIIRRERDAQQREMLSATFLIQRGPTLGARKVSAHLRHFQATHASLDRLLTIRNSTPTEHDTLRSRYLSAAAQRFEAADRTRRSARSAADQADPKRDRITERLSSTLARAGDSNRAIRIARTLSGTAADSALSDVITQAAADKPLRALLELIRSIQNENQRASAASRVLQQLIRLEKIEAAEALLPRLRNELRPSGRASAHTQLALGCIAQGRWDDAAAYHQQLTDPAHQHRVLQAALRTALTRDAPQARRLAQAVFDQSPNPGMASLTAALVLLETVEDDPETSETKTASEDVSTEDATGSENSTPTSEPGATATDAPTAPTASDHLDPTAGPAPTPEVN